MLAHVNRYDADTPLTECRQSPRVAENAEPDGSARQLIKAGPPSVGR